jgi:hypothetical protein
MVLEPPSEVTRHLWGPTIDQAIGIGSSGHITVGVAGGYAFEWTLLSAAVTDELVSRGHFPVSSDEGVWVLGVPGRVEDGPFHVEVAASPSTDMCGCGSRDRAERAYRILLSQVDSRAAIRSDTICIGGGDVWVDYFVDGAAARFFGFARTSAGGEVGCIHYTGDSEEFYVGGDSGRSHETAGAVFKRTGESWVVETSSTPRAVRPDRRFTGRFQAEWNKNEGWGKEVGVDTQGRRMEMRECWGPNGVSRLSTDETVWTSSNAASFDQLCTRG